MIERLLTLRNRGVYRLKHEGAAAVYYLADDEAGGVLINTPPYSDVMAEQLTALAPTRYLFYPSRFGAVDVDRWRAAAGAESLAFGEETAEIRGHIDIVLDRQSRLTRTIDFLPMSGRTAGSGVLRARNLPGVLFLGPVLSPGKSGWPTLAGQPDDYSYENRLFGCLGLKDLSYEYAFTDIFVPGKTRFGPGASSAIRQELIHVLGS
ncbi:MAG: MBL fold metallo-hydrolase [Acidiferrobacterales bacterium]